MQGCGGRLRGLTQGEEAHTHDDGLYAEVVCGMGEEEEGERCEGG